MPAMLAGDPCPTTGIARIRRLRARATASGCDAFRDIPLADALQLGEGSGERRSPTGWGAVWRGLFVCGHPRDEEFRFAVAELRSHSIVRGAEDLAGDGGCRHQRFHEVADVGEVLQRGV